MDNGKRADTYHDHRRALENTDCNEESPSVAHSVRLCYEKHDVSTYAYNCATNDEIASILHLVGVVCCHYDSDESCHVWRHSEQLSSSRSVSHSRDDRREEESEALDFVSARHDEGGSRYLRKVARARRTK